MKAPTGKPAGMLAAGKVRRTTAQYRRVIAKPTQ